MSSYIDDRFAKVRAMLTPQLRPADAAPSIPSSAGTVAPADATGGASGATETVAQAYLAALAAQGKNTAGDTAPYVVIPNQANTGGGGGISIIAVLVVVALGVGAWWILKKRGEA